MIEPPAEAKYQALEDKVRRYHPNPQFDLLRRSFEFAHLAHSGQKRSSGEPYLVHPLGVADIIAELKLDMDSLCAGLLHDVLEDTDYQLDTLEKRFNREVAFLVDGVTKLSKLRFKTSEEHQAETIRKMIVAMSRDIRVVLVKLADRVHNMRTLEHLPPAKQRRIAQETLDIYAPLASRLGIHWIKLELEDTAFRFLDSEAYYDLAKKIALKKKQREGYVNDVLAVLRRATEDNQLKVDLHGRPKHFFSIWKKMQKQSVEIEQIYDIIAFRILVDEIGQCYEALGIVHNLWRPLPARFKDYIAMPKPNGYQSLHTSVIGPFREPIEIQIRTHDMHRVAEEGVAAHWVYKQTGRSEREGASVGVQDVSKFTWLRQLIEDFQEVSDPRDFMELLKLDLFSEEVFIFTPRGDIRSLPLGATVVDFAYSIHTEVGHHCAGAKVNGLIVSLGSEINSGDVVEILTRPQQRPKKEWLEHVKTGRARSKIKHFLQTEARQRAEHTGRELFESETRKYNLNLKQLHKKGQFKTLLDGLRLQTEEEMYIKLGYGSLSIRAVLKRLIPDFEKQLEESVTTSGTKISQLSRKVKEFISGPAGVRVDGVDDELMVRYARCCSPIPGEHITGFITRGRGLTVHSADCPRIQHLELERQIDVFWDEKRVKKDRLTHTVKVEILSLDERGLLAEMSSVFSTSGINIQEAHCRAKVGQSTNTFDLAVSDRAQLDRAIARIEKLPGVLRVTRMRK